MAKRTVLVVDDDESIRSSIKMILEYEGYATLLAPDGLTALRDVDPASVDTVLLDVKMPAIDGIEVLERLRARDSDLPIIMISGHGMIETAVEATKKGAFDFLEKPLDRDRLLLVIRNAVEQRSLLKEFRKVREASERGDRILGESPAIRNIHEMIKRAGPTDARMLISGENGTGKELVARALHRASQRAKGPFVEVNCAAIPKDLIESELFGHEKGAFTGAASQYIGKFEQADGGTIFLDEVGDMSLEAQAKVLRVLEEGKVERVGGRGLIQVDVRLLAATNKDLPKMIEEGTFREDFYHRLNVIPIQVPPLRERKEDIRILGEHFIREVCERNGMPMKSLSSGAFLALERREWRGNVRELRNVIERLAIMTPRATIDAPDVEALVTSTHGEFEDVLHTSTTFQDFKERSEAAFIKYQLDLHKWNISRTAEALGIQRSHLYTKMKRYGLMKEDVEEAPAVSAADDEES
ncbi:MAG: Fis family transcriptional regulator [Ignavibacteriales bacterium CG07_land_8_20_14_0_80_59_12]|nr:MAG: Fis family transcriptional regulator [Ignavibacteriales bacterium CG07_land_8_20_14_0_80_59_12]